METCTCSELGLCPHKGHFVPNVHPVGIAPDKAQGTCPLTHYHPLTPSRGGTGSPPAGRWQGTPCHIQISVSAPSPSRVYDKLRFAPPLTTFRLLFSVRLLCQGASEAIRRRATLDTFINPTLSLQGNSQRLFPSA